MNATTFGLVLAMRMMQVHWVETGCDSWRSRPKGQQAMLMLHRMPELLVTMRTMQVNRLRGLLYEFGAELPPGRQAGLERIPEELIRLEGVLPAMVLDTAREQLKRIEALDRDVPASERRLAAWKKDGVASRRLMDIPGAGLLTATAAVATIGEARALKSGREFAAFVSPVPRQAGTGGRVKLLGISKRGDVHPRTLLIHGDRRWQAARRLADQRLARRPFSTAVVALANKMARTIWALLDHERTYRQDYAAKAA